MTATPLNATAVVCKPNLWEKMLPILIRVPAETAVRTEDVGIFARWRGEPTETRESKNESKAEDVQPGSSEFDH